MFDSSSEVSCKDFKNKTDFHPWLIKIPILGKKKIIISATQVSFGKDDVSLSAPVLMTETPNRVNWNNIQ